MAEIVVVGIHTGIGKTVTSAVLCQAFAANYWKPVQAGALEHSDSMEVERLISNEQSLILPEKYRLQEAMSPHAAALHEGIKIELTDFILPNSTNHLIVETAGGLMSPMTAQHTVLDGVKFWKKPVLLVSQAYLGSINHTLLCLDALKRYDVPVLGVVYSGDRNEESEAFIAEYASITTCTFIAQLEQLNAEGVSAEAEKLKRSSLGKNILAYFSENA